MPVFKALIHTFINNNIKIFHSHRKSKISKKIKTSMDESVHPEEKEQNN